MQSCIEFVDTAEWMREFRMRVARERIPFTAHLELTGRCNLRCQHCYLGDQAEQHNQQSRECSTTQIKQYLDEWAEAGCLHLVITGGDPMIRSDFCEIYRHAANLGLLVTVFCNGTLVTDPILELFREYPPRSVEITIYGATAAVHDAVTRVPGSHDRGWIGIHRLLDANVRVVLKAVVMQINQHEVATMVRQAETLKCKFRFDAAIFPRITDGSMQPLDLRVLPDKVVALDMAFPERRQRIAGAVKKAASRPVSDRVYPCGAGNTAFFMDCVGNYSPCLMTTHYRYPAEGRAFSDIWNVELCEIRHRKRLHNDSCLTGDLRGACSHCPAFNYLETGNEEVDSPYTRETAERRYAAVRSTREYQEAELI